MYAQGYKYEEVLLVQLEADGHDVFSTDSCQKEVLNSGLRPRQPLPHLYGRGQIYYTTAAAVGYNTRTSASPSSVYAVCTECAG